MKMKLANMRTSQSPLGHLTVSEAKARAADWEQVAARAVPSERARLLAAARDLSAKLELVEQTAASKATSTTTTKPVTTGDLEKAFCGLGMSESHARIAVQGRHHQPVSAGSLAEAGRGLGMSASKARTFSRGRFAEAVVKNVAGLTAACFAYVPDSADPTTWLLQICRSEDPGRGWQPASDLVKAAVNSLPGLAPYGAEIAIPASALPGVKSTLRAAWIAANLPLDDPAYAVLQQEALRQAFRKGLGLSEQQATIAASGRSRRS